MNRFVEVSVHFGCIDRLFGDPREMMRFRRGLQNVALARGTFMDWVSRGVDAVPYSLYTSRNVHSRSVKMNFPNYLPITIPSAFWPSYPAYPAPGTPDLHQHPPVPTLFCDDNFVCLFSWPYAFKTIVMCLIYKRETCWQLRERLQNFHALEWAKSSRRDSGWLGSKITTTCKNGHGREMRW